MPLQTKYRPTTLEEVMGNEHIKKALSSKEGVEDRPHTYMFHGCLGSGKTTLAYILAKDLGCHPDDLTEVDAADVGRIDFARAIKDVMCYKPQFGGTSKVYIFDECQSASRDFFEALLKSLEKPPKHVYFILCTTDPQKIPATIKSRCTTFEVKPLDNKISIKLINTVLNAEGVTDFPEEAKNKIVELAEGIPRNILNLLDKVVDIEYVDDIMLALDESTETQKELIELIRGLLKKARWSNLTPILAGLNTQDHEKYRRGILGYCAKVLLSKEDSQAAVIMDNFKTNFFDSGWPGFVLACYGCIV